MIYFKRALIHFGSWETINEQPRESRMETSESRVDLFIARLLSQLLKFNIFFLNSRLCTDLTTLIQERSEIEKAYSKSLKQWSKKWGDLIEKGNDA